MEERKRKQNEKTNFSRVDKQLLLPCEEPQCCPSAGKGMGSGACVLYQWFSTCGLRPPPPVGGEINRSPGGPKTN